jgi:3-methyladenine DNA glycosylase AlkC
MPDPDKFLIRDVFNKQTIGTLANNICKNFPEFDKIAFEKFIYQKIADLSFKARCDLICQACEKFLPKNFEKSAKILIDSLPPILENKDSKLGWENFIIIPQAQFIEKNGLENFELSMQALYEMTKRFSSEFAIRKFIINFPEKTLKIFEKWAQDKNYHVRRLVSEGLRPRLPWASPLSDFKKDPQPIIKFLDILKDDAELYVRKSVANNLNDISKDNPEMVIDVIKKWQKNSNPNRDWVIKHALRTLLKKSYQPALDLMKLNSPNIKIIELNFEKDHIKLNENLSFLLKIDSLEKQKLMVDCKIYYVKSNKKLLPKVFKLFYKNVGKERILINKKIAFREMTTRKHYSGGHFIEIIINGCNFTKKSFYFTKK